MHPSRGQPAVARDSRDCDPDDRAAPRGSAGGAGGPHAVARPVQARRMSADSTADFGCTDRKPRSGGHTARTAARRRPGSPATNSEKLDAARATVILRAPLLRISTNALAAPEGSERELRAFVLLSPAIVTRRAPRRRVFGRARVPATQVTVGPDQAGGNTPACVSPRPPQAAGPRFPPPSRSSFGSGPVKACHESRGGESRDPPSGSSENQCPKSFTPRAGAFVCSDLDPLLLKPSVAQTLDVPVHAIGAELLDPRASDV